MYKIDMKNVGLADRFIQEASLYNDLIIGRVVSQSKDLYKVVTENGEMLAEIAGKFRYLAKTTDCFPAVGDFVMLDRNTDQAGNGIIHCILTRKTLFERKAAGTGNEIQVVAANIDTVFICMALNNDFNLRRLERYLSIAWQSGALPVVVLTKSDLCHDLEDKMQQISAVAIGVDIIVTNSMSEDGFLPVKQFIGYGKTVAFIGSSGVGKSTLINRLLGEDMLATNGLRNDDKGRHTTTRRDLIILPDNGAVIDTPGMRELGLDMADVGKAFADIDDFAVNCRFADCSHTKEPGCAVQKAIAEGLLAEERLDSYRKLKKEAKYEGLDSRQIEKEKLAVMFSEFDGVKNARDFIKSRKKR